MKWHRLGLISLMFCGLLAACSNQGGEVALIASAPPATSSPSPSPTDPPTEFYSEDEGEIAHCGYGADAVAWFDADANGSWDAGERPLQDIEFYFGFQSAGRAEWTDITDSKGEAFLYYEDLCEVDNPVFELWLTTPSGYRLTTPERIENLRGDEAEEFLFGFTSAEVGGITPTPGPPMPICTPFPDLSTSQLVSLNAAPDGSIWAATYGDGVYRYDPTSQAWMHYGQADGLISERARTVAFAPDAVVWIGTEDGLSRFDGASWVSYTIADGLVSNAINDITIDHAGSLWLASPEGVSRFNPQTEQAAAFTFTNPYDMQVFFYRALTAQDGSIWFATLDGAVRLQISQDNSDDLHWTFFAEDADEYITLPENVDVRDVPLDAVAGIAEAPDGTIWFNFGALFNYTPSTDEFKHVGSASTSDITVGPDGAIWWGTYHDGAVRSFPDGIPDTEDAEVYFTRRDGLLSDEVAQIVFAPDGAVWFASSEGPTRCIFP